MAIAKPSTAKMWKYLSISLMGILATGFLFPQAFAHVTTDMKHGLEHVLALLTGIDTKVTAIKAKTDNLPSNPASTTDITTKTYGSKVIIGEADILDGRGFHQQATVTSDHDYTVCYVLVSLDGDDPTLLAIFPNGMASPGFQIPPSGNIDGCVGGDAGTNVVFSLTSFDGSAQAVRGFLTLTTSDQAVASITNG
jgi:hypothetical protein